MAVQDPRKITPGVVYDNDFFARYYGRDYWVEVRILDDDEELDPEPNRPQIPTLIKRNPKINGVITEPQEKSNRPVTPKSPKESISTQPGSSPPTNSSGSRGFHGATGENANSVPTWARPVVDLAGYAYVGGYGLVTAPARLARGVINFVDRFSRMDWEQRILTVTQPLFQTALHFSPQGLVRSWLNQAQSYWDYANDPFSGNWAAWNYITSGGTDGLAYQTGDFIGTNATIAAFAFAGGAPFAGGGVTSIFPEGVPTVIRAVGGADEALSVLSSEADYWRKIARLHGPGDTVPLEQLLETRRIMLQEAKQTYHSMGKRVKVIRPAEGELVKDIPFASPNPAVPVPLATRAIQFSSRGAVYAEKLSAERFLQTYIHEGVHLKRIQLGELTRTNVYEEFLAHMDEFRWQVGRKPTLPEQRAIYAKTLAIYEDLYGGRLGPIPFNDLVRK